MSTAKLADRRHHNFHQVDNEVVDDYIERVPETRRADALAVYSVLCRLADPEGVAWPGVAYIGRKIGRGKPTVIDAIKELGRVGLVGKEQRHDEDGGQRTNVYVLLAVEKGVTEANRGGNERLRGGVSRDYPTNTQETKSVEANASSGIAKAQPQSVALEKHVVDGIYGAMREARLRLPNDHYPYHLGRAKDVLAKDEPTDLEIEALPEAFVRLWTIKGKADPHSALMELRRQAARPDLVRQDGPAPWEPVNPHGERKSTLTEAERERVRRENAENARMLEEVLAS